MDSQDRRLARIIARFAHVADLFAKLSSRPYDFGTDERLYRSEIHVIEAIGRGRSRTVTELGTSFGITKGAVSQVVSKLDAKGYITKERNPEYSKELLLSLSEKGRAAFEAHEALHAKISEDFFSEVGPVSDEEFDAFERLLGFAERYIEKAAEW
ncbi:MAG: MarR family transcriptional regulator [Spirochaetes bacterium]|nr:MarR family transcriptional regulator [Spirochaetota bacterium]MBU1079462.1 MarR family transcriptional regulator [Spirochaetota bacterium]